MIPRGHEINILFIIVWDSKILKESVYGKYSMDIKIKHRYRLKAKEIKKLSNNLKDIFEQDFFDEKNSVETADYADKKIVLVDGKPNLMFYGEKIFFTLSGLNIYKPKYFFVVVDMGAVKFVSSGADVMAPGIVDADKKIRENDIVWICDERHHKPLAIGVALMDGEQMINAKKGKSIHVFHHVGDELWNLVAKSL